MIAVMVLAGVVLLATAVLSIRSIIGDVRGLHRSGKRLTDREGDVSGLSAGAVTAMGNNVTH